MIIYEKYADSFSCCSPVENRQGFRGAQCMAWRWRPLQCDDLWKAAVKNAAIEIGDKSPSRTRAADHVASNREKYGLPSKPFEGFCGLAGNPKSTK